MTKKAKAQSLIFSAITVVLATLLALLPLNSAESATVRKIIFPVIGKSSFVNDFNAPRWLPSRGKVKHNATDIIANKRQPLVSAVNGTIIDVQYPEARWGYNITIRDSAGYRYTYIHMNNDNRGNDNKGGPMRAYAVDMNVGNKVVAGQLIGWVGDSGYSNGIPHLHFEIEAPNGSRINPYYSLRAAKRISQPVSHPTLPNEILPYGAFRGGANLAMGNFDTDSQSEFVTGAGPGGGPHVRAYDHNNRVLTSFYAYSTAFKGGVDVATGDIDGDGIDELITGAYSAGNPHVKIFKLDGRLMKSFYAFESSMNKGVKVSSGDVDGDGMDEVAVVNGPGRGSEMRLFKIGSGQPQLMHSLSPYTAAYTSTIDISIGDVIGDSKEEIVTVAGLSGSIKIFDQNGLMLKNFSANGSTNRAHLRISIENVRLNTSKSEILTIPSYGYPEVKMHNGNGLLVGKRYFLERWWAGNYDIAAGYDTSKASAGGNRRSTVRLGID
jgi:hypothetical protein